MAANYVISSLIISAHFCLD